MIDSEAKKHPETPSRSIDEAIRSAHSVTVEFGTGLYPLFLNQTQKKYDEENLYIGVNIDELQHDFLKDKVSKLGGLALLSSEGRNGERKTRLPEGCADLVFMGNVFGEPDSKYIMYDFHNEDGQYKGNSSLESKVATLSEVSRILKPSGELVILETYTPYRGSNREKGPAYSNMSRLLQDEGFSIVDAVDSKEQRWDGMVSQFSDSDELPGLNSYMVVAKCVH